MKLRNMKLRNFFIVLVLVSVFVGLTGCVPGDGTSSPQNPAGFFWGIFHGWVAPISLVIGLFKGNIRIYEPNNIGWLYDFGFYMAIISGFGGLSLFRKKGNGNGDGDD